MSLYDNFATTALDLLTRYGSSATITRHEDSYDPATGVNTPSVVDTGSFVVLNPPASSGTVEAFDNRQADPLQKGKIRFLIVAAKDAPFTPDTNDLVAFALEQYTISGVTPLAPGGTVVLWKMGLAWKGALAVDFSSDFSNDFGG